MDFFKRTDNSSDLWNVPNPLKKTQRLPNNKQYAVKRATVLANSLRKNDAKRQHFTAFMKKIFNKGHAGPAEPLEKNPRMLVFAALWGLPP